jgi:ABC-type nitrate/sulfonate/bicarbonate transport system substrate-binding protein
MKNQSGESRRDFLRLGGAIGIAGFGAWTGTVRAQAALQQVRIVNTGGNSNQTMQELLATRFLGAVGLEAVFTNVSDGAQAAKALLDGTSDICMLAGFGPVLPAIEGGAKLKVVAGANLLSPQAVFSAKPEIRTVKDLEGKTVGTGAMGAALHQKMVALLRQKGIDEKKVTFVNIGSSAAIFKAVIAGKVDAGPADVDVFDDQARYGVHSLSDGELWKELPLFTNQASYTSERAITEKRDILVRTLAAHARLYRFVSSPESKDAFVGTYLAKFKSAEPSEPLAQWNFYQRYKPYAVNLVLTDAQVRAVQDVNVALGLQKAALPFDVVTDMSLAREALKLVGSV